MNTLRCVVVSFVVVFMFTHAHCSQRVSLSRRIDGVVSAVTDTHVFIVKISQNITLTAYRKTGKSFDTNNGSEIVPPVHKPGYMFAMQIGFNKKFIAVSARDYRRGAVFMYTVHEHHFTFQQMLLSNPPDNGFGACVAMNDNNDIVIASSSYIHIFSYNNSGPSGHKWTQDEKFDCFGIGLIRSCDISANEIVVGATWPSDSDVHIYTRRRGEWMLTQTLTPRPHDLRHTWPRAVKMNNNRIIVGDENAGKVYVYKHNSWFRTSVLAEPKWLLEHTINGSAHPAVDLIDSFGFGFDVYGDVMAVGAPTFSFSELLEWAGLTYIFKFDTHRQVWEEKVQLKTSNPSSGDLFGKYVHLDGNFVCVVQQKWFTGEWSTYVYEYGDAITSSERSSHQHVPMV